MKECCESKSRELVKLRESHAAVLKTVLAINLVMFVIEAGAGLWARSSALLADSLDMLGDASVYAFSLFVLGRGVRWQASAAVLKAFLILFSGFAVVIELVRKLGSDTIPIPHTMGLVGGLALVANTTCLLLLLKHRNDDINMRSTWRCSRNDIISNCGVLIAAVLVGLTHSLWPDVIIGGAIALIFFSAAIKTFNEALREWRAAA